MNATEQTVFLVLTSALVLRGEVVKAGTLVEVVDRDAKQFLQRGKARLATEKDGAPAAAHVPEQDEATDEEKATAARAEAIMARAMADNQMTADTFGKLSKKKAAAALAEAAEKIDAEAKAAEAAE